MNQKPSIEREELKKLLLDSLFEPFEEEVIRQKKLLSNTEELYQSYYERLKRVESKNELTKYINESNWLKNSLYVLLENEFPLKAEVSCQDAFESFYHEVNHFIDQQPKQYAEEQSEQRFLVQKEDAFLLQIFKTGKNAIFHTSRLPQYLANLFAKEKKPIKRWKHKVPLQAIITLYFRDQLVSFSMPFLKELQLLKCDALSLKWQIDKELNIELSQLLEGEENVDELLSHIESISEKQRIQKYAENFDRKLASWKEKASQFFDGLFESFKIDLEKVNTIELNSSSFSEVKLAHELKLTEQEFLRIYNGWRNTLFAQIDDFQVDIELYRIKYVGLLQYSLMRNSCRSRIENTVGEYIEKVNIELDAVLKPLAKSKDAENLVKSLQVERKKLNRKLSNSIIPKAIDALYNQNFPNLIERLELRIKEQISKMQSKRIIYAKDRYNVPISKSQLSHFNPRELVEVDLFAKFDAKSSKFKTEVIEQLQTAELSLNDLIGIVDYNLDAAINSVAENESQDAIRQVTLEGLERTKAKTDLIKNELGKIQEVFDEKLQTAIKDFNLGLIELTDNENITNLRMQLAKARAVEKTAAYRKEIIQNVKNFAPILLRFIRQRYGQYKLLFEQYSKRLGLIDERVELTAELTDFLSQTEKSIQNLPFVYRRLYQIKALEEDAFFVGRNEELKQLETAYDSWEKGNYSATLMLGEKGSGASSIINFFKKDNPPKNIVRHKLKTNRASESDFIAFFQELLDDEELKNFDQIVNNLNSRSQTILVLEDVQHFFIKTIHGFDAINLLFELISQTAEKVFWLLEMTVYAETYLQKTIGIERYFKYKVRLGKMTEEQIVSLVMKRHRVSGYNLKFENDRPTNLERRKLQKMTEEEQQKYLSEAFFKDLNSFAESNISLALLYWLRSTTRVEENTIYMGKIKNVKFNFLSSLQQDGIFTLHALMLHDSLSVSEHALIFNQSQKQSRMNFMVLEDGGILDSKDGRFYINRLLYRQVVNMLSSKNIIH